MAQKQYTILVIIIVAFTFSETCHFGIAQTILLFKKVQHC